MATAGRKNTVRVLGVVRRNRRSLMMGTALQATVMLVLTLPAQGQPAPNARPYGGVVVGGSATISRTTSNTQIDQASQRAAINWRTFDIGSQQSVTFNQPAASAVVLNRVTGPDPSQIAGRIDANGQFILVNQSGVNFYKGAQINAAGVMVSAADITNKNFMKGVMKFDKAGSPNAKIDNQGIITVQQAGLAALVAPQVANSGTISAKLGHVQLAGAKTATLDLYGDGLLSLDVTNQVKQAPVGPDGKAATALVTNTGTIIADGGTVQLTARAADGIVQTLVQAGGTIRAATMGDQTGVVALNGVGGSIVVEGQLSARGSAPGTKGGAIEIASNRDVVVAARARIDASGAAGGGVAAIGTTRARAKGGPGVTPAIVARNVTVQSDASVAADATTNGNGGNVTVLSSDATKMDGLITVRGGAQGGNGGLAEISGGAVSLTKRVDAAAPLGLIGTLLLDPLDLFVSDVQPPGTFPIPPGPTVVAGGSPNAIMPSWISPAVLEAQTANISLGTTRDLFVNSPVTLTGTGQKLTLQAGHNLDVEANLTVPGNIVLNSHTDRLTFATGALTVNAVVQSAGSIFLGGHNLSGTRNPATGLFDFLPGVTIGAAGSVRSVGKSPLISIACDCAITATPGAFQAIGGTVEIGPLRPGDSRDLGPLGSYANSSIFVFGLAHNPLTGAPLKDQSITINPTAPIGAATLDLEAIGGATQLAGSPLTSLGTLVGSVGSANLTSGLNTIGSLGPFTTTTGDFSMTAVGPLNVAGALNVAGTASLQTTADLIVGSPVEAGGALALTGGSALTIGGPVTAPTISLTGGLGGITLTGNAKMGQNGGAIDITSTGPVFEAPTSTIIANSVTSSGGVSANVSLLGTSNAINVFHDFSVTNGDLVLVNGADLTLFGTLKANNLFFEVAKAGGTLTLGRRPVSENITPQPAEPAELNAVATGGRISLVADNYNVLLPTGPTPSSITTNAGTVELAPFSAIPTSLSSGGLVPLIQTGGGTLEVGGFTNVPAGAITPTPRSSSVNIAGALALNNAAAATLRLDSTGSITQAVGPLTVANLTGSAGTFASLTQPTNQIDTLGAFSTKAGFALVNNKPLLVAGPVTDTGGASTLALTTRTGDITLAGNVSATNVVNLISAGAINQTGGSLVAGTLTGSAATSTSLTQPANQLDTLGAFSTTAGFALVNNKSLLVAGPVQDAGGASTLALTTRTGDITLAGNVSATNAVDLNSAGAINQTAESLVAGTLTGSAATSASLTQPANQIDTLGAFSTKAGFALVNNKSLLVAGPVTDTGGASTLALTTRTGDNTLAGNVSATNVVDLNSAGAINQTAGSLVAGTLTGSAATSASLTQPANQLDTLGAFSTTVGFALVNNKSLLVAGPVQDTGGASTLALTTRTGDITLAGNVSATNAVDLNSASAIVQTGGLLAARSLTGSAGSSAGATLTSDNAISFFGPFTTTLGVIDLVDSIPLTINGALTARLIVITATGSISLASDITTGGLANFTTVPTDPLASLGGAFFIVLPDASGNSAFAANSNVASLDGTGTVMLLSMPPQGGNVGLTNLNAPGTELFLNLGSGNASGQVDVGSLFVLGAGGQVNFTSSTVQGFTGSAAALAAQSFPPANPAYLVNGCEIGVGCIIVPPPPPPPPPPPKDLGLLAQGVSVSSGILNIVSSLIQNAGQSAQGTDPRGVPILNPMRDLSGGPLRDRQSDPDLMLPNVSEKDY